MALTKDDRDFITSTIKSTVKSSIDLLDLKIDNTNKLLSNMDEAIMLNSKRLGKIEIENAVQWSREVEFDKTRASTCPTLKELKNIDESLLEYKMAMKYPKSFFVIAFIFGFAIVAIAAAQIGII